MMSNMGTALHIPSAGARYQNPKLVNEMDMVSKRQFWPESLTKLDGKMKSNLGVNDCNSQFTAAMESDDAEVP
jgi:hypothetical protein